MTKRSLSAGGIPKIKATSTRQEIPDKGAAGLHLVIQPSGAKSFALRFRRPNGARAKVTLGPFNPDTQVGEPRIGAPLTLASARALAGQLNMERAGGVDLVVTQRVQRQRKHVVIGEAGSKSFSQAARDFLANHRVRRTGQKPKRWRETASLLGLRYPLTGGDPLVVKGGLCAVWRDRRADEIDADDIYTAIQGKDTEPTRRRMADALGTMFGWLLRNRRIKVDPCAGIYRPPAPPSRHRVLSAAEVRELWTACDAIGAAPGQNTRPPWGALIKLLLLTGARRNEIARLEDEELNGNLISLPASRTKNHLPFDLPLSPLALEILEGVQRMPNCKYVFSTTGKTPISGFSKVKKRLDEIIAKNRADNGVRAKMPAWRIHDLRRVASTGMNDIGVFPHVVEAVLNHVSGAAKAGVAGTYNKAKYNPEKRAALEAWADHVRGIVS
jgi:integrase